MPILEDKQNSFVGGGKIKYTPGRVKSDISAPYEYTHEDNIRNLALERDLTAANLLENDILLDLLDDAIDEQMKEFALTVPELAEAATQLCGSPTVTWECYKKAKELLRIAPWIAYGYDPVQSTFVDKFTRRKGNVVFDCKKFDPDAFHDLPNLDADIDDILDGGEEVSPSELEKAATENQKKWALLVLFWDLLWGKAWVKPGIVDNDATKKNVEQITEEINKLKAESQDKEKFPDKAVRKAKAAEAEKLALRIGKNGQLPNTIMVDRPRVTKQLQCSTKDGANIENNLRNVGVISFDKDDVRQMKIAADALPTGEYPWVPEAAATWVDFASLFKMNDHYKDKSIPAIKSGFLLSILIGFLGLPPKVCFFFIKGRITFLRSIKWMTTWKIPLVKIKLFMKPTRDVGIWGLLRFVINSITAIPAMVNTIFLEICIWLAKLPNKSIPNVSDAEPEIKMSDTNLNDTMDVGDTNAGFVAPNCLVAAQEIVNRVNLESIN